MADFRYEDHGTVGLLKPLTSEASAFLDEHVESESWQWTGGALACHHRLGPELCIALRDERGFDVEVTL